MSLARTSRRLIHFVTAALFAVVLSPRAGGVGAVSRDPRLGTDEVVVRFKQGVSRSAADHVHSAMHTRVNRRFRTMPDIQVVTPPAGARLDDILAAYRRDPTVAYAEPNYRVQAAVVPNDPDWPNLWNMSHIDAPRAWDLTTGSNDVVVAVPDSGIEYTHPDLAANVYRNESDCDADGADDDLNGYVDDCFGIDPASGDSDPMDDNHHGTVVSGIIGASGNDGIGVVGVNWHVKMFACKMLGADGLGSLADALTCLDYFTTAKARGVNIVAVNASWVTSAFSQALSDAVQLLEGEGVLFVAAAGNAGTDLASCPAYPAGLQTPGVISVAMTTESEELAFSSIGPGIVHVGAPGYLVESTDLNADYSWFMGTSIAAPHVTGVAALLKAYDPLLDWKAIKNLLIAGGDPLPALASTTLSGRRLNAYGSLTCQSSEVIAGIRPVADLIATQGSPFQMSLSALHIDCDAPAGDVTVVRQPGNEHIALHDDGAGSDRVAGDGIYTADWMATLQQTSTLTYPDGDVDTVHVWPPLANVFESPVPASAESFATSLALTPTHLFVGAPGDAQALTAFCHFGAVYMFDRATGALVRTFVTPAQDTVSGPALLAGKFGVSIAVDGDRLLVGGPFGPTACLTCQFGQALVFDTTTGDLVHVLVAPPLPDGGRLEGLGSSVAMAGSTIAVGAPETFPPGGSQAYDGAVVLFDATTGAHRATIVAPSTSDLRFGRVVATNGTRVAASAVSRVYVIDADPSSATFAHIVETYDAADYGGGNFGDALAFVGDQLVVGAPTAWDTLGTQTTGAVFVFDGSTLVRTWVNPVSNDADPGRVSLFGSSLASAGDGVVVGAPEANAGGRGFAYVFGLDDSTPSKTIANAVPPLRDSGFGRAVVALDDTVVVGAPAAFEGAGFGAAFVFSPTLDFPPPLQVTLIPATTFKLRDHSQPPANPARRSMRFKSLTSMSAADHRVVPPPPGSSGDPTLHGAVLTMYNAAGLTLDSVTVVLPATGPGEGWTALGSASAPAGYVYKNASPTGPVMRIVVKPDKLVLRGGKASWSYTLDETAQGAVAMRLQLGGAAPWCAAMPARSPLQDRIDVFDGQPNAPPPAACPLRP